MSDSFRTRLLRGDLLIGTIPSIPAPEVSELLSSLGFDWLFVDMEHGSLDGGMAQRLLQAIRPPTHGVIRVPIGDDVWLKKCLDLGPDGIIVPLVNTKEDAERVVALSKFPPQGRRSVGVARAHGYGLTFQEYVASANEDVAVIVQAEHIEAVRNIESILDVEGIDAIFVGPYDLSGSMGKPGQVEDDDVQEQIAHVRECAKKAGVRLGIFGVTPEAVKPHIESGYTLISMGMDTLYLGQAAKDALAAVRQQ